MYNNYFESVYSKFWTETTKKYGMEDGIDSIIKILTDLRVETAFEVGIGTGWPIADSLAKSGVKISGCDISKSLIEQTKNSYPDMDVFAGTIWEMGGGDLGKYDMVYCIRSSWYMKDFLEVIGKMFQMTKNGGYIVFNIINKQNDENRRALRKSRFHCVKGRIEGALKVLLYNRDYFAPCPPFYYTQSEIEGLLCTFKAKWRVLSTNQLLDSRTQFDGKGQKLLFIVQKL